MGLLQELDITQIGEALAGAVDKSVPATVTIPQGEDFENLRSRCIALQDNHLLLEMPTGREDGTFREFTPGQKVGLSFKLKHYKHISNTTVVGSRQWTLDDGTELQVLCICTPLRMVRVQRRAFMRADVPENRVVRTTFWLGGLTEEPTGNGCDSPVWSGRVTNLSAGGVQIQTSDDMEGTLDVGDTVGVRIVFGVGEEVVYTNAQFRHMQCSDGEFFLGFQFVGLDQTPEGRAIIKQISGKVSEYHRLNTRAARRA